MGKQEEDRFPEDLLQRPREEWARYFVEYAARHPVLDEAFNRLVSIIKDPGGKQLVFVIGPPGVGKTFLMKAAKAEIQHLWMQQQLSDRGRIPVVGIEVPSKDQVKPSYAAIYERLLLDMEEPLIDKKIVYGDVAITRNGNGQLVIDGKAKRDRLRYAFEQALKHRRPYAIFLDETQHLLDIGGLTFQNHMDCLKSIANLTNTLYVLFGTYEMTDFLDLSDQLARRSIVIHFRRYEGKGKDKKIFLGALKSFQINMPFKDEPDLLRHWEFFHERTAGCVGSLYDSLVSAYKRALEDPKVTTLTAEHLGNAEFLSAERARVMARNLDRDEKRLIVMIGNGENYFKNKRMASSSGTRKSAPASKLQEKPKKPRKRRRVGDPNPIRYRTGTNDEQ